jgi:hypothetical protein
MIIRGFKNKILAIAKPNKVYLWHRNYINIVIEARLIKNQVQYYEKNIHTCKEIKLSEELVKELFLPGTAIKDQPFLIKENLDFYIVLHRTKKRFIERYYQIKNN